MNTNVKPLNESVQIKRYKIQFPISTYTFPNEALIKQARFDSTYLHIDLTDGRVLSIPLQWIPTVQAAVPAEREKYTLSRDRTIIIWDPETCSINDEVRLVDYLGPDPRGVEARTPKAIKRQHQLTPRSPRTRGLARTPRRR